MSALASEELLSIFFLAFENAAQQDMRQINTQSNDGKCFVYNSEKKLKPKSFKPVALNHCSTNG